MEKERRDHRKTTLVCLRELHRRLEQYDSYAVLDLTLHAVCEGDLALVDACKRTIVRALRPQTRSSEYPRVWVEEAIEAIDPTFAKESAPPVHHSSMGFTRDVRFDGRKFPLVAAG